MPYDQTIFSGSVPDVYDSLLVPMLFAPFAQDLVERLPNDAADVLELAAGTGVVTARLTRTLPGAAITATDLNSDMLRVAQQRVPPGRVIFGVADAQSLPFGDAQFDAVVCQFGLMFMPDQRQALSEARRVLRRGGAYLANIWCGLERNLFASEVASALELLFPDQPPRFLSEMPYAHGDRSEIETKLEAAGFRDIRIDRVKLSSRAASAADIARAFCQGTPLAGEIKARAPGQMEFITSAITRYLDAKLGFGRLAGTMSALVIEAHA